MSERLSAIERNIAHFMRTWCWIAHLSPLKNLDGLPPFEEGSIPQEGGITSFRDSLEHPSVPAGTSAEPHHKHLSLSFPEIRWRRSIFRSPSADPSPH
ncbi:hypothetical protein L210DRAFT_987603 [Boletus edulis BED1]|uniref:Uncharacterized protein n=1 Tax=Boletus edulis BED1 TaxID=1328754 RepID=A0AAD4BB43_BOLED|nr:hypothetical protein L210DRAFT_987603 [Boletus edulis BED1]